MFFPNCFQFGRDGIPLFHHRVELLFQFLMLLVKGHIRSSLRSCHSGFENGDGRLGLLYLRFTVSNATFQFFELLVQFLLLFIGKLDTGRLSGGIRILFSTGR